MSKMNSDIAMRLDDVSIKFRLRNGKDFFAVKNLSLTLQKGDILGILGRNGSGKSTLLKTIAGILSPDSGSVYVNGVIAPLIELGASFLPDLTGKENIFLAGSYFGYPKKTIKEKLIGKSFFEKALSKSIICRTSYFLWKIVWKSCWKLL